MRRLGIVLLVLAAGCRKEEPAGEMASRDIEPPRGSQAWKVRNARSAAPGDIAMDAAVVDWPANDTTPGARLVIGGGGGWTCMPDNPETPANDPFCADDVAMTWSDAYAHRQRPRISGMGVAYGLQGGNAASYTDPAKMAPDSGQDWLVTPPFIAIVMPDPARSFRGLPTAPSGEGPWVMYAGTPYAHLMVPTR